jgi:hypothetical protein
LTRERGRRLAEGFFAAALAMNDNRVEETTMPQSTHDRAAELHNIAAHAHEAAAAAHAKGDHLTAHELASRRWNIPRTPVSLREKLAGEARKSAKPAA